MLISDNGPNTLPADRERVQRQIKMQIADYADIPELIGIRLRQLDREWDIERIIERRPPRQRLSVQRPPPWAATVGSRCLHD